MQSFYAVTEKNRILDCEHFSTRHHNFESWNDAYINRDEACGKGKPQDTFSGRLTDHAKCHIKASKYAGDHLAGSKV